MRHWFWCRPHRHPSQLLGSLSSSLFSTATSDTASSATAAGFSFPTRLCFGAGLNIFRISVRALIRSRPGYGIHRQLSATHHHHNNRSVTTTAQTASSNNNTSMSSSPTSSPTTTSPLVVVNDDEKKDDSSNTNNEQGAEEKKQQGDEEEELRAERQVFDSLFSTRRPKDGWAGLSSGLKSVAKGTVAGVASLIAAPIAGAQQDGVRGLLTGLATGVASAVALPVTGICVGAYQIGRGIVNSGEAFSAAQAGMIWDEEKREWLFYLLDKERAEIVEEEKRLEGGGTAQPGGSGGAANAKERKVKDREYYDLLGVSTNVTSVELKKAYYKQSRQVHPDRNPNDPQAAKKFQELSHAYQILSNDQARTFYDKNGKAESSEAEMQLTDIDPYVFFAVMFGSDQVRPYIGELWIANKADSLMKDQSLMQDFQTEGFDEEAFREKAVKRTEEEILKQQKRQVECAINLRDRVQPFVDGTYDEAEFVALCQEEAATITKGSFGEIFCTVIGFALEIEAMEFIGTHSSFLGIEGQAARLRKKGYSFSNQMKLVGAGIGAARAGSQAYKEMDRLQREQEVETGEDGPAAVNSNQERVRQATEKIEETLPAFLELAWAINTQDITRTLKEVCRRLFHDAAEILSLEIRLKRAEGVRLLGREFHTMGRLAHKTNFKNVDAQELRRRAEVAAMTTLAHAQGQEVTDKEAEEMIRHAREMEAAHNAAAKERAKAQNASSL